MWAAKTIVNLSKIFDSFERQNYRSPAKVGRSLQNSMKMWSLANFCLSYLSKFLKQTNSTTKDLFNFTFLSIFVETDPLSLVTWNFAVQKYGSFCWNSLVFAAFISASEFNRIRQLYYVQLSYFRTEIENSHNQASGNSICNRGFHFSNFLWV